jgi:hypothetical protein
VLGRAWCVTAERNGPNVPADERIPFGALAETDLPPMKRCPPIFAARFSDGKAGSADKAERDGRYLGAGRYSVAATAAILNARFERLKSEQQSKSS